MPAASRRRTNTRRQPSSDIEEGASQMATTREDVDEDEEEEQPVARSRKVAKKEKKPVVKAIAPKEEEDDEDDEPIDVDNFPDYPLGENDIVKLKGLSKDWTNMIGSLMGNISSVGEVGSALIEHGDKKDIEKYKEETDAIMKDFLAIENTMTFHATALDEMLQKLGQHDTVSDVVSRYNKGVAIQESEHAKKTSRQKYAKDDKYRDFKQSLFEAEMPESTMPPITEFIPKEDGDDSDDDDEIEIGGVTQDYKCPITLCIIEDPVTCKKCKHHFSGKAITQLFNGDRNVQKDCPASGCHVKITLADCVLDKDLAKKIKVYQRRMKRREDEMEVDEVIE